MKLSTIVLKLKSCGKEAYFIGLGYLLISLYFLSGTDAGNIHIYKDAIPVMKAETENLKSTIPLYPDAGIRLSNGFDGDFSSVMHSAGGFGGGEIIVELPQEVIIDQIKISPQTTEYQRAPRNFTLSGSRNGVEWEKMGNYAGLSYAGLTAGQFKEIGVQNKGKYRYYRFEFKKNHEESADTFLTFSELQLASASLNNLNLYAILSYFLLLCMAGLVVFLVDRYSVNNE